MDNENKNLQNQETELDIEAKVRQDVSEKIAAAAAEIQDEIDGEKEVVEENDQVLTDEYEEGVEITEEVVVKEPKKVTLNLSSLIISVVGSAIIGALILLLGLQVPGWLDSIPGGKAVAKYAGEEITDYDMKYYIYQEATEYISEIAAMVEKTSDYDWSRKVEENKTAEQLVKERAMDAAVADIAIMKAGKECGVEWDKKASVNEIKVQMDGMINQYGKELMTLNAVSQGLTNIKQYKRKVLQMHNLQAVQSEIQGDPSKFYPEDLSVLNDYTDDEEASAKHILIKFEEGEDADNSAKKALAEEVLAKVNNGEDFDALVQQYNEDQGQDEEGYTFGRGEMVKPFEDAVFGMGIDQVSGIVESEYGYHIIKRVAGTTELKNYLIGKDEVKIKKAYDKMSVKDILLETEEAMEKFQVLYAQSQAK